MMWIQSRAWAWAYSLEELRERAQTERHLWTQAAACVGLAILRRWGC